MRGMLWSNRHNGAMSISEPPEPPGAPNPPRRSALQRLQDSVQQQPQMLRQFQQIQNLVKQPLLGQQMQGLLRQVEPLRQIWEVPERMAIPKYLQEAIASTSIATLAQRLAAQPFPQNAM